MLGRGAQVGDRMVARRPRDPTYVTGRYTIGNSRMAPHLTGSLAQERSQFLSFVDAESAVLDAAHYADQFNLWRGPDLSQARIPVINGPVGVLGRNGALTNWIRVTRTGTGLVHGWPAAGPQ